MNIKTEVEIQEQGFHTMKKRAIKNKYNLVVYPGFLFIILLLICYDLSKLQTSPFEEPLWFVLTVAYITFMAIYAWVRGTTLNRIGGATTDDLNSICYFISKISKYDLHLKVAVYGYILFALSFIRHNPEFLQLNVMIGILMPFDKSKELCRPV